jgi:hypothetical protein
MSADHSDFIAKLHQIEELASVVHAEIPQSRLMWRTRIQHIVVLAKTLRGRLEFGTVSVVSVEPTPPPGDIKKPPTAES